jgi:hypothetical protein
MYWGLFSFITTYKMAVAYLIKHMTRALSPEQTAGERR